MHPSASIMQALLALMRNRESLKVLINAYEVILTLQTRVVDAHWEEVVLQEGLLLLDDLTQMWGSFLE